MARTLFVSDVHLRPADPRGNRPFLEFLEEPFEELYLVGDIFDYWIGPRHLEGADYRGELEALRRAARRAKLYFIRGNRDYLVDGKFEGATGIRVLGDRARLELGGLGVLLAHGDFIYNKNPKYAAYRALMKSRPIEDLWRTIPASVGKTLARGYRKVSPLTTPVVVWKREELLARARPLFVRGADVLICGHIHQPQRLPLEIGERRCEVFILGDWCGGTRDFVEWDGRGFFLRPWPT